MSRSQGAGTRYRIGILATHPIQYYAPLFRRLAEEPGVQLKVFYGWKGATEAALDHQFGRTVRWDIPLLDGYEFEFLRNVAADPGTHHFRGIDLPGAAEAIASYRPDAVLIFGWAWKAHLEVLRRLAGTIPILFRGDSTLLDETRGLTRLLRRALLRWVYRHVDVALYVGTNNRKYYEAHGVRGDRLVFAPHAVDNARFQTNAEATEAVAAAWRKDAGIPEHQVVIVFAGKLEPKKGPDLLLDAFVSAQAGDRLGLVFCGSGALESRLKARNLRHVHFMGFRNQSEMPWAYRTGDAVVLPSRGPGETWGLALNEAMACGRPVIASDKAGAACDLIAPGENGWVFPANDQPALSALLRRCAEMGRKELRQMGRRSEEKIVDWSFSRQVAGILEALQTARPR